MVKLWLGWGFDNEQISAMFVQYLQQQKKTVLKGFLDNILVQYAFVGMLRDGAVGSLFGCVLNKTQLTTDL